MPEFNCNYSTAIWTCNIQYPFLIDFLYAEYEFANRFSPPPSVFEKLYFKKETQIFNFEYLSCSNSNCYSVACTVKVFYQPSGIKRYNLLSHYYHLNIFKQRSEGKCTQNAPIFADIFQFILKTKGLEENLTTPRDAADIFLRKTSTKVVSYRA